MKVFGKIISVLIVFLILVFSILSVSGFSYYFGDNKITVFKGIKDLKLSDDLGGGYKLTLTPVTTDEVDSDPEVIMDTIEKRAAAIGFKDYRMYIQDSTGNVEFIIPYDVDSEYAEVELAALLVSIGDVTIRPGNSFISYNVDSTGKKLFSGYEGTESESVLMDWSSIENASVVKRQIDGETRYCLDIEFNDDGTIYLSQITDPTAQYDQSYYNSIISLWVDDRMISYSTMSEHITDGVISITDEDLTKEECEIYAAIINSEPILLYVSEVKAIEGHNVPLKMVTLIAGIVILILAVLLIYRYRANGIITLVSLMFQFALLLAVCTGFFANTGSIVIDVAAASAIVISLMFTVFCNVYLCDKLSKQCTGDIVTKENITDTFRSCRTLIFDVNILFALISLMGILVFGTNGFAVSLFGNAVCGSLYNISLILLIGSGLNFICGYFLPELLMHNFKNFRFLEKSSMFGGKK